MAAGSVSSVPPVVINSRRCSGFPALRRYNVAVSPPPAAATAAAVSPASSGMTSQRSSSPSSHSADTTCGARSTERTVTISGQVPSLASR